MLSGTILQGTCLAREKNGAFYNIGQIVADLGKHDFFYFRRDVLNSWQRYHFDQHCR